jgi:saccharopine dehydrogenase-like NADP-dependent oxidoreductase
MAWGSKLQPVVAEIIVASDEAVYCQKLFRDAGAPVEPMTRRVDSQAALRRMYNELQLVIHASPYHVREKVARGEVRSEWVETKRSIADTLT